jgi:hypothetical protein
MCEDAGFILMAADQESSGSSLKKEYHLGGDQFFEVIIITQRVMKYVSNMRVPICV